jgi:hypothetical protein
MQWYTAQCSGFGPFAGPLQFYRRLYHFPVAACALVVEVVLVVLVGAARDERFD